MLPQPLEYDSTCEEGREERREGEGGDEEGGEKEEKGRKIEKREGEKEGKWRRGRCRGREGQKWEREEGRIIRITDKTIPRGYDIVSGMEWEHNEASEFSCRWYRAGQGGMGMRLAVSGMEWRQNEVSCL